MDRRIYRSVELRIFEALEVGCEAARAQCGAFGLWCGTVELYKFWGCGAVDVRGECLEVWNCGTVELRSCGAVKLWSCGAWELDGCRAVEL